MDIDNGNIRPLSTSDTNPYCLPDSTIAPDSTIMPPPPVPKRRKSKKTKKPPPSTSPLSVSSPSTHFAKLSLLSPTVEVSKSLFDVASYSFNNRPLSPTPSSPTSATPTIKLRTIPISPLPAFTSLPPQSAVARTSPVLDPLTTHHSKAEPQSNEISALPASPNLLRSFPGLSRGRKEEPFPVVATHEPRTPSPMETESPHPTADGNTFTCTSPTLPTEEIPPVIDLRPSADPPPPHEPPAQQPSDHFQPTGTPELPSSPSPAQTVLQVAPQDTPAAEPPTEVEQEPERQPTPPPSVREVSPAPQKVKTSFKDFLMRKKKEQVESPVITSSTIPALEPTPADRACGSDGITDPLEEATEAVKEQGGTLLEQPSRPLATRSSDVDMDTSGSPAHEPGPIEVKSENSQPPRIQLDGPSESWLLDSQLLQPGLVVDLRQESTRDWASGEPAGVRGVIESIVNIPGRPPTALCKPIGGKTHPIVAPVMTMAPVRPSEEGEVVVILSDQHKGKVGKVTRLAKDMVSVDLDGPETFLVDVETRWLCLFFREGRAPPPSPLPAPPRVPPEKCKSMSPSPAPQSEDGEIPQDLIPRNQPQQAGASSLSQTTTPLRAAPLNAPTQPRSFQNAWKNNTAPTIPSRPNSLSHLINANPNGSANNNLNNLSNTFANSSNRPGPPSGPKALRGLSQRLPFDGSRYKPGGMGSGLNGSGNGMGVGLRKESNPNNGHPAIPRGPSADRERDRERSNGGWSTKNWGNSWR